MAVITPVNYDGLNNGLSKLGAAMAGGDPSLAMDYAQKQATAKYHLAEANKTNIEAQRLAQFNNPVTRSKIAGQLMQLTDAQLAQNATHAQTGSWGSDVFQEDTDPLLSKPAASTTPLADMAAPLAQKSSLAAAFNPVVDKSLPLAAPKWSGLAGQLDALIQADPKSANPQQLMALKAQTYLEDAIKSGDYGAMNAANTLAKEGATYTPYKLSAQGLRSDEGSGQVAVGDKGLYDSILAENKSKSAQNYASANNSNAQAQQAREGGKWTTVETSNGLVQVNQQGEIRPLGINKPGQGADKSLTEFQGKAFSYGTRAMDADKILNDIGTKYSPIATNSASIVEGIPGLGFGANAMLSTNDQTVMQAKRNFVNAVLRQESGATISPSEFRNAEKQYFPQPGDKPDVIAQKAANRARVISSFKVEAGPAAAHFDAPVAQAAPVPPVAAHVPQVSPAQPSAVKGLQVGMVVDGHTYQGGNPNNPTSWR